MAIEQRTADPNNPEFQAFLQQVRDYYANDDRGFKTYFDAVDTQLLIINCGSAISVRG